MQENLRQTGGIPLRN